MLLVGLYQILGTVLFLTAFSDDSQAGDSKVLEPVCGRPPRSTLDEFHFSMEAFGEAFGDAIAFAEALDAIKLPMMVDERGWCGRQ